LFYYSVSVIDTAELSLQHILQIKSESLRRVGAEWISHLLTISENFMTNIDQLLVNSSFNDDSQSSSESVLDKDKTSQSMKFSEKL
jgi:hypothetical protein